MHDSVDTVKISTGSLPEMSLRWGDVSALQHSAMPLPADPAEHMTRKVMLDQPIREPP